MQATATALAQRLDMLNAGLDLIDQGVTVFDADLKLVAWNRTFLNLLGFPAELAYIGAPFEHFIRFNAERGEYGPGDVEAQVAERVASARAFKPHQTERARPDGRILAIHGEPLPHKGFVALYSDITEQRYIENLIHHQNIQLEERVRRRTAQLENANANLLRANRENSRITAALRQSEERLRLITDTIPALIAYFDKDRIYRYTNKGYSAWFGRGYDEMANRPIVEALGDKFYAAVRDYVDRALAGEQVTYEYSMEKEDGSLIFARSTLVPERGPDGDTLGCFVLSFDITEQKRTQAALVQAQKMEAVGQLTGGLAHDFNNMLTVVIGNLAALRERSGHDPEVCEYLDPALHAAERGVDLIKRLLSFSRQQPLEPRPVAVGALIQGMMKLMRRSLPETIAIEHQPPESPLYAMADSHQLESALLNLALNARDAMPEGGRLHIHCQQLQVSGEMAEALLLAPGDYVQIDVTDSGHGMDPATQARVFEPFFTTKRFGSGSGLGLSMVYGFLKQSGGNIRLQSQVGRGSTFSLFLPRTEASEVPSGRLNFSGRAGGRIKPLVLLVEDDVDVRRVVRLQLTGLGYPVLEAENGEEAVVMIENVPDIGLLLSDVVMPGLVDGKALARFAHACRPQMRIALMSGYTDQARTEPADAPHYPLLNKPFNQAELAAVLDKVLQ
ncbi:MAG: hypothetical protein RIR00_328 [Pseudomonadota bacterium]|jgi:PAS domain S-box-containing protein